MADAKQPRKKKRAQNEADATRRQREADELRREAEERLGELSAAASLSLPMPEELAAAVHELRVHQIELEMQNEELRRAQLELEMSHEKYFELFDRAPVGYLTLSDTGIVRDANLTAARLLGVERQILVGQPFSAFVFTRDRDVFYLHQRKLERAGRPQTCELRLQRVGGSTAAPAAAEHFWAQLEGRPKPAATAGEQPSYMMTFIDIGTRVAAQQEVERLNTGLEQRVAERTAELAASLGEMETFSYSVSHDLRAPLRTIDGFSEILIEDYGDRLDDEGKAHLGRVRKAAQRMGQLIDDLLELASLNRTAMTRRPVDVSTLAAQVVEELRAADPKRRVTVAIAAGLVADADPSLLRAVLVNLLGNAWKFTSTHKTARIEVGAIEANGGRAYFVRDDGIGFDMAYVDKLFGPFQRLHPAGQFEGTGVGLATVQRIVLRHGGRVWAKSEVEKGACFSFTLPATDASAKDAPAQDAPATPPA
jgi:PAS domain S-box-containing protein